MREHDHERERAGQRPPPAAPAAEVEPLERLASNVGNQAFGAIIGRQGAGILPDGRAHPDVESAIARSRGGGSSLDTGILHPEVRQEFADVRVHADSGADALARSVSARAFTTGSDVYFAAGEYRPGSGDGNRLLAHELAHVVQQRGAATSGPLTVSSPGDALEVEADAATDGLLA
jgi:hypothetical protein